MSDLFYRVNGNRLADMAQQCLSVVAPLQISHCGHYLGSDAFRDYCRDQRLFGEDTRQPNDWGCQIGEYIGTNWCNAAKYSVSVGAER